MFHWKGDSARPSHSFPIGTCRLPALAGRGEGAGGHRLISTQIIFLQSRRLMLVALWVFSGQVLILQHVTVALLHVQACLKDASSLSSTLRAVSTVISSCVLTAGCNAILELGEYRWPARCVTAQPQTYICGLLSCHTDVPR